MIRFGVAEDRRRRRSMEDRAVTGQAGPGTLLGVFDGHGGAQVAEHAAAAALGLVRAALERGLGPAALWRYVFTGLDLPAEGCGSTATLLLVGEDEVSAGWVGDSRALLVTDTAWRVLTPDHRIDRPDERRRVVAAGALLVPPYVVDPRLERGLMVTRALGDRELRRVGITAEPEVMTASLGAADLALVVATDGLWDVVESEEAARACRREDPAQAARHLVELVAERDGTDNVTVLVGALAAE